jgi:hypothetical protein
MFLHFGKNGVSHFSRELKKNQKIEKYIKKSKNILKNRKKLKNIEKCRKNKFGAGSPVFPF